MPNEADPAGSRELARHCSFPEEDPALGSSSQELPVDGSCRLQSSEAAEAGSHMQIQSPALGPGPSDGCDRSMVIPMFQKTEKALLGEPDWPARFLCWFSAHPVPKPVTFLPLALQLTHRRPRTNAADLERKSPASKAMFKLLFS